MQDGLALVGEALRWRRREIRQAGAIFSATYPGIDLFSRH
jgi:hypothetical protein